MQMLPRLLAWLQVNLPHVRRGYISAAQNRSQKLLALDGVLAHACPRWFFALPVLLAFGECQRFAFGGVVAIPLGNLDDIFPWTGNDSLTAEA